MAVVAIFLALALLVSASVRRGLEWPDMDDYESPEEHDRKYVEGWGDRDERGRLYRNARDKTTPDECEIEQRRRGG